MHALPVPPLRLCRYTLIEGEERWPTGVYALQLNGKRKIRNAEWQAREGVDPPGMLCIQVLTHVAASFCLDI